MAAEVKLCTVCQKKINLKNPSRYADTECLRALGVSPIPNTGWHWHDVGNGKKVRMYPICERCNNKLEAIVEGRKRIVKGKITTKKN